MKKLMIVVVCLLVACPTVFGATLEEGVAAHRKGDYATAGKILLELAEDGDPMAQFILGGMYSDGKGFAQAPAEAYFWMTNAISLAFTDDLRTYIVKCREIIEKKLTPAQCTEIQERSKKWQEAFAKHICPNHPAKAPHEHDHGDAHDHPAESN
ncbi:sel1 repeat family protein [Candidatus Ozemobacteraceae bacterium]|nr:sel1 repeat family protein [Candidatus Ozemobacteraceae bacterium]